MLLRLRDDPDIGLVTVVLRGWIRVIWRQPIVDAEDRNTKLDGPLPRICLVSKGILAHEATSVEVDDRVVIALNIITCHSLIVYKSNFDVCAWIVLPLVRVVSSITTYLLLHP